MLKFVEFLKENKDTENSDSSNRRISNFANYDKNDMNFIKSLMGDNSDKEIFQELYNEYQEFKKSENTPYLQKERKYLPLFFKIKVIDEPSEQDLMDLYKTIQKHRNTIKQNNIDLTICNNIEELEDRITDIKLIEKSNKFIKLIPFSNIRKEIKRDPIVLKQFSDMLIGYSYEDYKNTFMKKAAKYRTLTEFLTAFENHLSSFSSKSQVYENIENHPGSEVVYSTDDYVVARIYSKRASCDLGSQQWCIAGDKGAYWDNYISSQSGYNRKERPGVQYFIWDFNYKVTDNHFLIGVTKYNDNSNVAHDKSDESINVTNKEWYKYLISFGSLDKNRKIRLIADNIDIEKYTHLVDSLGEEEKREILKDVPKLLLQFQSLDFLDNEEIWDLVKKDVEISENLIVAKELNDNQKISLVVKNPDLLEFKWDNNPYNEITDKLTRKQRVQMVSNKHSLYKKFDLSEDEHFDLISLDPQILISYTKIAQEVDQNRLAGEYLADKERWDREISKAKGENKTQMELILRHLIKASERIEMENKNNCFITVARTKTIDGIDYLIPEENELIFVEDILSPSNQKISTAMLIANFDPDLEGYSCWIPRDLILEEDLNIEGKFILTSDIDSLINKTSDNEKDQKVYDALMKTLTDLETGDDSDEDW